MVVVKSAGETYTVSSGKQMPWEDVPQWFKDGVDELKQEPQQCPELREKMQKCVEEKGFWHTECAQALEDFDRCQTRVAADSVKHMH